ncbi:MAG: hypothetical protein ACXV2B_08180, partial [Halobacteriota archaeon]
MIAGLPGTAIGGAFYLLMAAWVHVKRTINKLRGVGAPEDNRVGTGFLVLTVCIIAALVATSWLAGWLAVGIAVDIPGVSHTAQVETLLQFSAILLTFVILLALVVGVHGLRLVTSGRTPAPVRLPGQLLRQRHFLYSV